MNEWFTTPRSCAGVSLSVINGTAITRLQYLTVIMKVSLLFKARGFVCELFAFISICVAARRRPPPKPRIRIW